MAAPPSQTYRQIGFLLSGAPSGDVQWNYGIRPEELTMLAPSRLAIQQTIGGAWADAFDEGVATINLSGHNGWKGGALLSGEDMFLALRATVFTGWHQGRRDLVSQGQDPSGVKLYFTDSLDSIAVIVAPRSFTLRRSKSSPLLIRYQINLAVLGMADNSPDPVDSIINAFSNPLRWLAANLGLTSIIGQINRYIGLGQAVFGAATGAIVGFVNIGVQLIASVAGIAAQVQGQFSATEGALLNIGTTFSRAASTAFAVLADDDTLSDEQKLPISGLSSAFNSAACSMANGYDLIGVFPDYSAMHGASTCSSTGGGDPASAFTTQDINPFTYVSPSVPPQVQVTADAQLALLGFRADPISLRGQQANVTDLMRRTAVGVTVA